MNTIAELENLIRVVAKRLKTHSEAIGESSVSGAMEIHGIPGTIAGQADIATHAGLTTGVHGAGASTLATTANVATHATLTASHGVAQIADVADAIKWGLILGG